MLKIVIMVDESAGHAIGVKEDIAMTLEQYGDVQVVSIEEIPMEQLKL